MSRSIFLAAFFAAAVVFAGACGPNLAPSPTSPSVLGTVTTLTVSGTPPTVGSASQFNAIATLANGTRQDVTKSVKWETSSPTQATVTSDGVVNAVAPGPVTIVVTFGTMSAAHEITIAS